MTSADIVDSTYSPTQSVVTFLTQAAVGTLSPSERVFDFEVSSQSQDIYSTLMNELMTYSSLNTTTPENYLKTVTNIFLALDTWSKMKNVTDGIQYSNQSVTIQIYDPNLASILSTAFAGQKYSDTHAVSSLRGVDVFNSTTGVLTIDSTMTRYMAEKLDTLVRTMRASGWDPVFSPFTNQTASDPLYTKAMDALFSTHSGSTYVPSTTYGVYDVIQKAIDAAAAAPVLTDSSTQSQSLQQLLMVDYVVRGNELLYGEMSNLNTAINLNQNTLSYLNSLQDLLNQKDPEHFLLQLQCLSNLNESSYSTFEEQTFGSQSLGTTPKFTEDQLTQYVLNLRMKAMGVDPTSTDPIVKAQYGISNSADNLMAVMDYNISHGLVNADGTISGAGLDPRSVAVQNQFCLSAVDVLTYKNGVVPAIQAWYSGNAANPPAGYPFTDYTTSAAVTAFKTWFDSHNVQGYYGITSYSDTIVNMINDHAASFTVGTNILNADPSTLASYGLGQYATSDFSNICGYQTTAYPSLDKKAMSQAYLQRVLGTFDYPQPSYTFFDPVTGLPNPSHPMPTSVFGTTSWTKTLTQIIAQIVADNKNFHDTAVLTEYGVTTKPTTGAVTSTGTAADAFINSASNSFSASLETIRNNLQSLINKATTIPGGDASPLVTQLNVILSDFKKVTTVSAWVKDYDTIGNEGNYQRHMNDAITASQAFNDTERENLRRVMFVYEEFYKSATAMLDKLNTIIEKMGSAIKG